MDVQLSAHTFDNLTTRRGTGSVQNQFSQTFLVRFLYDEIRPERPGATPVDTAKSASCCEWIRSLYAKHDIIVDYAKGLPTGRCEVKSTLVVCEFSAHLLCKGVQEFGEMLDTLSDVFKCEVWVGNFSFIAFASSFSLHCSTYSTEQNLLNNKRSRLAPKRGSAFLHPAVLLDRVRFPGKKVSGLNVGVGLI